MSRLLVVDDESAVLNALWRVLRRHFGREGVTIELCEEPLRAVERLAHQEFDVVLSDLRMPLLDGIALLARARELQPRAVRMMLSASTELPRILGAVNQAEVFRFIPKPWSEEELVMHLRAALDRADELRGRLSASEIEIRRLEAIEPGITEVRWGPSGEVLMSGLLGLDELGPQSR